MLVVQVFDKRLAHSKFVFVYNHRVRVHYQLLPRSCRASHHFLNAV